MQVPSSFAFTETLLVLLLPVEGCMVETEAQATITTLFSSIFVLPGLAKGNTTDETGYSRHLSSKLNDKPTLVTQDNHGLLICWTVIHIDHQIFHWQIHYISLINVESNGKSPNISPPISICQKYFQPF